MSLRQVDFSACKSKMAVSHVSAGFIRSNLIMYILIYAFQTNQFTEMTMNLLHVLSASQDGCVQVHLFEFTRNE